MRQMRPKPTVKKPRHELDKMPSYYSDNYEIIWLAERYCVIDRKVGVLAIIRDVCNVFELREHQIYDRTKVREISIPRQIAMYVAKEVTRYNDSKIAKSFNRDRTSFYWGISVVSNMLSVKDDVFMKFWRRYLAGTKIYKLN